MVGKSLNFFEPQFLICKMGTVTRVEGLEETFEQSITVNRGIYLQGGKTYEHLFTPFSVEGIEAKRESLACPRSHSKSGAIAVLMYIPGPMKEWRPRSKYKVLYKYFKYLRRKKASPPFTLT